jgi:hypothetical protein
MLTLAIFRAGKPHRRRRIFCSWAVIPHIRPKPR